MLILYCQLPSVRVCVLLLVLTLFQSALAFEPVNDGESNWIRNNSISNFIDENKELGLKNVLVDSDNDGIDDDKDLCPNTPDNTQVNEYGCPITISCNLNTSSVSLIASPNNPSATQLSTYLLTDSLGVISQILNTPNFAGLAQNKTYMIVAISYENDGSLTGLQSGGLIKNINANCYDFSNALLIKSCVQNLPPLISNANFNISAEVPNSSVIGNLNFSDPENGVITLAIISGNSNNIFTLNNTGQLSVANNLALLPNTTYNLMVEVSDDKGLKSQATITIMTSPDNDLDKDGVENDLDLCPNTPANTQVNEYGCPISISCNLGTTSVSVLASPNNFPSATQVSSYVLTDSLGVILQISNIPTFAGLAEGKTYMIVAISYENDGSSTGLQSGGIIKNISANCIDFSNALIVKTCISQPCDKPVFCIPISFKVISSK